MDDPVFVAEGPVASFVVAVGEDFEEDGGLGEEEKEHGLKPVGSDEDIHVVESVGEFARGTVGVVGEDGDLPQMGREVGADEGEGLVEVGEAAGAVALVDGEFVGSMFAGVGELGVGWVG